MLFQPKYTGLYKYLSAGSSLLGLAFLSAGITLSSLLLLLILNSVTGESVSLSTLPSFTGSLLSPLSSSIVFPLEVISFSPESTTISDVFSSSLSHGFLSSFAAFSMLKVFSKLSKLAQPVDSTGSAGTTSHGLTGGSAVLVVNGSVVSQAATISKIGFEATSTDCKLQEACARISYGETYGQLCRPPYAYRAYPRRPHPTNWNPGAHVRSANFALSPPFQMRLHPRQCHLVIALYRHSP